MWKIVAASMGTTDRAYSKAALCLAEFVTPKDRSRITQPCTDGNVKLTFSSTNMERETI
jgi:hypothetical protein